MFNWDLEKNMKKLLLLSILVLTGCGTLFSGTTQDISFDSNVKDVAVYVDGAFVCRTPCIYPAERASGNMTIVGKKKGYSDVGISVKTKLNPVAIGNLIFVYSWTTDLVDGAAWKYRQEGVYLNMEKEDMKVSEAAEFKKASDIRRFALFTYDKLKLEAAEEKAGDYINALSDLSGKDQKDLLTLINQANEAVELAHELTGIR